MALCWSALNKMVIAIDFDGTIIKRVAYPAFHYELLPFAKEAILQLAKKHELVLNTSRYGWYRLLALYFVRQQRLPIKVPLRNKKCRADVYIDDCNIDCEQIDWEQIVKRVEELNDKN